MSDDLLDILGGTPPKKPDASKLAEHLRTVRTVGTKKVFDEPERISDEPLPHEAEFLRPVGITFLAKLVRKQPYQIEKRLAKCPIIGWHKPGGKGVKDAPLYDFMTAISYLVTPRGNIEDWFAQQNTASLPPYVNKMFWDSAHQRNRVMRSSGQLWHDDEVRLVLSRVDMLIRQEVKMWIEDLPEKELLNTEQYGALVDATNRLVEQVKKTLVEMPKETATFSMAVTIKDELEAAGGMNDEETYQTSDDQ